MATDLTNEQVDARLNGLSYAGEPSYLRVSDLIVDSRYQRPLNIRRVRRMAEEFDPMAVGMLYVSQRVDGTKVVLDGQTRKAMFVHMGWEDQMVPCFVYRGLTLVDEAKIFRIMNERRVRPTTLDLFRAKVVEGDPIACDINATLLAAGLRPVAGGEKNGFAAVGAAQRIYTEGGKALFRDTLAICRNAWVGRQDKLGVSGDMLLGVATLLAEYRDEVDLARLVRQMGTDTPTGIIGRARQARAVVGGETHTNVAGQLITLYNKNLRSNRLTNLAQRPYRRNRLALQED